jgi:hypothetical protein
MLLIGPSIFEWPKIAELKGHSLPAFAFEMNPVPSPSVSVISKINTP